MPGRARQDLKAARHRRGDCDLHRSSDDISSVIYNTALSSSAIKSVLIVPTQTKDLAVELRCMLLCINDLKSRVISAPHTAGVQPTAEVNAASNLPLR